MKCNAFTNETKSSQKKNVMLSVVHLGSILLSILKNPWFTRFLSQIVAVLFPPAVLVALRNESHIKVT